jgi:hypothetical protein
MIAAEDRRAYGAAAEDAAAASRVSRVALALHDHISAGGATARAGASGAPLTDANIAAATPLQRRRDGSILGSLPHHHAAPATPAALIAALAVDPSVEAVPLHMWRLLVARAGHYCPIQAPALAPTPTRATFTNATPATTPSRGRAWTASSRRRSSVGSVAGGTGVLRAPPPPSGAVASAALDIGRRR